MTGEEYARPGRTDLVRLRSALLIVVRNMIGPAINGTDFDAFAAFLMTSRHVNQMTDVLQLLLVIFSRSEVRAQC